MIRKSLSIPRSYRRLKNISRRIQEPIRSLRYRKISLSNEYYLMAQSPIASKKIKIRKERLAQNQINQKSTKFINVIYNLYKYK